MELQLNCYEVWLEGFMTMGVYGPAQFLGKASGDTFHDAVLAYYEANPSPTFDPAYMTDWGRRHFEDKACAREAFG